MATAPAGQPTTRSRRCAPETVRSARSRAPALPSRARASSAAVVVATSPSSCGNGSSAPTPTATGRATPPPIVPTTSASAARRRRASSSDVASPAGVGRSATVSEVASSVAAASNRAASRCRAEPSRAATTAGSARSVSRSGSSSSGGVPSPQPTRTRVDNPIDHQPKRALPIASRSRQARCHRFAPLSWPSSGTDRVAPATPWPLLAATYAPRRAFRCSPTRGPRTRRPCRRRGGRRRDRGRGPRPAASPRPARA